MWLKGYLNKKIDEINEELHCPHGFKRRTAVLLFDATIVLSMMKYLPKRYEMVFCSTFFIFLPHVARIKWSRKSSG